MTMYKILLVDDEEEIRKGIIKRIKWEELGFTVVGEAENGVEALDIIDKTTPDIVITDIKMPFMDGIKLAENIRYRFPTTKVIVLSGFDDFEYAQEAMKLGVMRYILKPINSIEMHELLRELKGVLDEEILSKNNLETLKMNYEKSLPLLKERFLNHWIEDYVSRDIVEENLQALHLELGTNDLGVAIIRPDELIKKEVEVHLLKNKSLLKMAIFNICEEIVKTYKLGILFMKMNEMVLVIPLEKGELSKASNRIFNGLEQIRVTVEKYLTTTVTIGVGNVCVEQSLLYKTYLSAVSALDYTITLGNNKVIYIEDIEPDHFNEMTFEEGEERMLLTAIKVGCEEEIEETVYKVLTKLDGIQLTLSDYQVYTMEIFAILIRLVRSMELESNAIFPNEGNLFSSISGLKTKEDIRAWLCKVSLKIAQALSSKRSVSKNDLIEKAKVYMQANYSDEEMSAEKLCNYLHISTNYFSALFKKETKLTFSNYLTQIRIEKAKELLRNTDMKAFDIGNKVGYTEGHYFSYVFKKVTGIAPTEYRNGKI